jgi:hypothetical protein
MTGIGPVAVRCPRVRDRVAEGSKRIRFSSAFLPPYARVEEPRSTDSDPLPQARLHRRLEARMPADCRPQPSGG